MKKKLIKTNISTINGKHSSLLNRSYYKCDLMKLDTASLEEEVGEFNKQFDLDLAINKEIELVKSYLKKLNLPSDEKLNYEFYLDYQKQTVKINQKTYKIILHPEDIGKKGKSTGNGNLTFIRQRFFSDIPAARQIGDFFFYILELKIHRERDDLDKAILSSIRAIQCTRAIVIAEFESEYLAEKKRQVSSNIPRSEAKLEWQNKALEMLEDLRVKGITDKQELTNLIAPGVNRAWNTVRKFLQGK